MSGKEIKSNMEVLGNTEEKPYVFLGGDPDLFGLSVKQAKKITKECKEAFENLCIHKRTASLSPYLRKGDKEWV